MSMSTFIAATATTRRALSSELARFAATASRRTVAIMQHTTASWMDTYGTNEQTQSTPVLADHYNKVVRELARREQAAIDLMHADLNRIEV